MMIDRSPGPGYNPYYLRIIPSVLLAAQIQSDFHPFSSLILITQPGSWGRIKLNIQRPDMDSKSRPSDCRPNPIAIFAVNYVLTYACMYACIHVCVCIYVCMYICIMVICIIYVWTMYASHYVCVYVFMYVFM